MVQKKNMINMFQQSADSRLGQDKVKKIYISRWCLFFSQSVTGFSHRIRSAESSHWLFVCVCAYVVYIFTSTYVCICIFYLYVYVLHLFQLCIRMCIYIYVYICIHRIQILSIYVRLCSPHGNS